MKVMSWPIKAQYALYDYIVDCYPGVDEIRISLCLPLAISSRSSTVSAAAVEIITYCKRHGKLDSLLDALREAQNEANGKLINKWLTHQRQESLWRRLEEVLLSKEERTIAVGITPDLQKIFDDCRRKSGSSGLFVDEKVYRFVYKGSEEDLDVKAILDNCNVFVLIIGPAFYPKARPEYNMYDNLLFEMAFFCAYFRDLPSYILVPKGAENPQTDGPVHGRVQNILEHANKMAAGSVIQYDGSDLDLVTQFKSTSLFQLSDESKFTERVALAFQVKKEVFVSYAWTDESKAVADEIDKALTGEGITLLRDRNEIKYKDSISAFMQRIGRGKAIVVILSKPYLESKYCMFELTEIAKLGDIRRRIFPIVLPDADINDAMGRVRYLRYWEDKKNELDAAMKTIGGECLEGIRDDIDLYARIRFTIADLLNVLGDMNVLSLETHQEKQFANLIDCCSRPLH